MKFIEILIALSMLWIPTAHAQINQSRRHLVAQFGEPQAEEIDPLYGSQRCRFYQDPWVIRAWLIDGTCQMISYERSGQPDPAGKDIATLLEQNANGQQWLRAGQLMKSVTGDGDPSSQLHFPRSDYAAYLVRIDQGLVFKTDHWKALEDTTAEQPSLRNRSPVPEAPQRRAESASTLIFAAWRNSGLPASSPTKIRSKSSGLSVLAAILISGALVFPRLLRLPKVKGWLGEQFTFRFVLQKLDPSSYRIFNDVYVPRPDGVGSTQIDHIVLSPFGIFVIETKNWKGWIFGTAHGHQWTQVIAKKRSAVENPLHQNALHVNALSQFLSLPRSVFHSLVFLVGECQIKTDLPPNVMISGLRSHIQSHKTPILHRELVARSETQLEQWLQSPEHAGLRRGHGVFLNELHGNSGGPSSCRRD